MQKFKNISVIEKVPGVSIHQKKIVYNISVPRKENIQLSGNQIDSQAVKKFIVLQRKEKSSHKIHNLYFIFFLVDYHFLCLRQIKYFCVNHFMFIEHIFFKCGWFKIQNIFCTFFNPKENLTNKNIFSLTIIIIIIFFLCSQYIS
jgi:hypothetical protein